MQREEFLEILIRISDGTASDQDIALYLEWYQRFDTKYGIKYNPAPKILETNCF
jgi:hypothetical protein